MKDLLAGRELSRGTVVGLLWLYALAAAPHLWHLSPLLMGIFYGALAWRSTALVRPGILPGKGLRALLTFAALGAVVVSVAGDLDGRALGVGLLTVMAGLKLLELHTRRDLFVMVFLGCFLLATQFLFDQGLWISLALIPVLLGLLSLLARVSRVEEPSWPEAWRETGRMMLAGVPMALLLFVLFPRLAEPLWSVGGPKAAVTGITDRITPGTVSQLSQSRAVAFRVSFEGEPPEANQLYWRGPVFWDTDGHSWTAARGGRRTEAGVSPEGALYQQVTLEPTHQHWLYALDRVVVPPADSRLTRDGQLLTPREVAQRRDYRVASVIGAGERRLKPAERLRALELPEGQVTTRMQALVAGWRTGASDAQVVARALAFYRLEPFVYTLSPPALSGNVVDGFLFGSRRGFCEHYATSFVVLMRQAGIPARMVAGYQGGEWNPTGGHFVVRQSDAHAWAEVWLAGRGWVRIDPTAAVAPERIERPIAAAGEGGAVVFEAPQGGLLGQLWQETVWLVDAAELGWQRWVVGFSARQQSSLLQQLGLGFLTGYKLALAAVAAAFAGLLPLWWWLRRQPPDRDPARRLYTELLQRLGRAGVAVNAAMAPSVVAAVAGRSFPDQAVALQRIVGIYLVVRYGGMAEPAQLQRLKRAIRSLRLAAGPSVAGRQAVNPE